MSKGIWYAVGAYLFWGFVPIFWKWLEANPALQLVSHRIIWSAVVLLVPIFVAGNWPEFRRAAHSRRAIVLYTIAAVTVAINWFVYVWAVNAGFIVQTALGYFINPLVTVLLGVIVFREKLRRWQWTAIGLAAAGVVYLTIYYHTLPWIALALALSFGTYGMVKKAAPLGAVHGLALETAILFLPALAFLLYQDHTGQGTFVHAGWQQTSLMIAAGPVTTAPLLLFAAAAKRIPLSVMGMLQFINPTIQFLLGVFLYHEPFARGQLVGFACVWGALALFVVEGYTTRRRLAPHAVPLTAV